MSLVAHVAYSASRIDLGVATANTTLDTLAIYREVRALRAATPAHRNFRPMITAGGNLAKIPGVSYTAAYVQLLYGCRIVPYNGSHRLVVMRDTFTDDGLAGSDCFDRTNLSPSVVVDIDVQVNAIEIRQVATGSAALTTEQATQLLRLAQVHGLIAGAPLVVTPTARTAGDLAQTITEANGTVTVSLNA